MIFKKTEFHQEVSMSIFSCYFSREELAKSDKIYLVACYGTQVALELVDEENEEIIANKIFETI